MILLEDKLSNLDAYTFLNSLLEYITKSDSILHAKDYWVKEHPDEEFIDTKQMRKVYTKQFPVKDIKADIHSFVTDFAAELRRKAEISNSHPDPSIEFGFSDYIYIDIKPPIDPRLQDYYENNKEKYKHVKVRFSDHKEKKDLAPEKKSKIKVNFYKRSFISGANEMMRKIDEYIQKLKNEEQLYLNTLEDEEEQVFEKLTIEEGQVGLNERLEEISPQTFCTDSANDIANWLLNKPKAYRI